MRALRLLVLLLACAACDAPQEDPLLGLASHESLGVGLRELPKATLSSIGLGYGLAVVRLGAAAERAGLRLGDVVYGVNQKKFESLEEFSRAIARPPDGRVSLLVRRGRTDLYVPMDRKALPPAKRPATDTLLRT